MIIAFGEEGRVDSPGSPEVNPAGRAGATPSVVKELTVQRTMDFSSRFVFFKPSILLGLAFCTSLLSKKTFFFFWKKDLQNNQVILSD